MQRGRDGASAGPETATLGDVLYGGESETAVVTEEEWVALVRAVGAGEQLALHELYERTHRIVFTLAVCLAKNREAAEEVTVDVFHDVWRRAADFDPAGGSVVGWIMNQARSRAIDRVRYEARKKRVRPRSEDPLPAQRPKSPEEALDSKEAAHHLRQALTHLTAIERQAIEVAFFSELTYAETAARLDEPLGTIKTRIRSGLSKLRQLLRAS